MIDIHAHILPSLDDGPKELELALEMAKLALENGTEKIIATPHVIPGEFDLSKEMILKSVKAFNEKLEEHNLPLEVLPGSEVYFDIDLAKKFKEQKLLTLNDTGKYALIELPMQSVPHYTQKVFFELKLLGIIPILAHPERNREIIKTPNFLFDLVSKGVLVQINATSLLGAFGNEVAETAKLFLKHNLVHFMASDCHSLGVRNPDLTGAVKYISQIFGQEKAKTLVLDNPLKVLKGEELEAKDFTEISLERKSFFRRLKTKLFS